MSKQKSVLLIGDFIVNEYFLGHTSKLDNDAPIPVVDIYQENTLPMGATLVAESLNELGLNVTPVGIIGDDNSGKWIKRKLKDLKIPTSGLVNAINFTTGTETRIFSNSSLVSRYDAFQKIEHIETNLKSKLYNILSREIKKSDIVILCDYGHTPLTSKIINLLLDYSKKIPVIISTTGENYEYFKNSEVLIKINRNNAGILVKQFSNLIEPVKTISEISKKLNLKKILLTNAKDGVVIYNNKEILEIPATKHSRIDPKGIGEIMLSAMALSLMNNDDFVECCTVGNVAAGISVSKGGLLTKKHLYLINKKELKSSLKEYEDWLEEK